MEEMIGGSASTGTLRYWHHLFGLLLSAVPDQVRYGVEHYQQRSADKSTPTASTMSSTIPRRWPAGPAISAPLGASDPRPWRC